MRSLPAAVLLTIAASPALLRAQRSDVSVSPFVSFLPVGGASPLAGMALALAGNGAFGVRGSAGLALSK